MCLRPMSTKDNPPKMFPCGKCPACLARRTSAWSFRLMQEDKFSISSAFITLTYAPKNTPITNNKFATLNKRDLQLFFKRLRKAQSGNSISPIRYYAVGEYGSKTMRPHYHAIIYNANLELIDKCWGLGHVHFGIVSGASVGYTLKYISKPSKVPLHFNDDRVKEFSLMSKSWAAGIYPKLYVTGISPT